MARRARRQARRHDCHVGSGAQGTEADRGPTSPLVSANPEFVAIAMPAAPKTATHVAGDPADAASTVEPLIQIELRRGPLHLSVRWPTSAADDCTAWLRELSSGLLK